MKKKYRVIWNEVYACSKVVEAESEAEAKAMCYDCDDPDKMEFSSYGDWGVIAEDKLNPNETNFVTTYGE